MSESVDWEYERNRISLCQNETYLMSAAAGILHPDALQASKDFLDQLHEHGDKYWELNVAALEETRLLAAELLNSKPEEVCFVSSSSLAISLAAQLLKSKGFHRFFSFKEEFPTTTLPFLNAGFQSHFVESENYAHEWSRLTHEHNKKSVIALSSVESLTGFSHPVDLVSKYAQEENCPLLVNATQSLGVKVLDAKDIPFVCASIHKWLMAGFGLSIFKLDQKYLDAPLPVYGWLSQKDPWKFFDHQVDPVEEARVFELGCAPLLQILSLRAVLKWIKKIGGVSVIEKKISDLVQYTYSRAEDLGFSPRYKFSEERRSSLVFFPVEDAEAAEKFMIERKIHISARAGNLRVAIHWFNNRKDIDHFFEAYSSFVKSKTLK